MRKVTNIRSVSHGKAKLKKVIQLKGQSFKVIHALKNYVSQQDKYLIYGINENSQFVF